MRTVFAGFAIVAVMVLMPASSRADMVFDAFLNGGQEVPPHITPATGIGTVTLNTSETQITATLTWQDLLAGITAAHIHAPASAGVNAPVLFPFVLGAGAGTTTGSIDPTPQVFAITPVQVAQLKAGLFYMNVHDSTFPGGEIRGQLSAVPEPSSLALAGFAAIIGCGGLLRRRMMA